MTFPKRGTFPPHCSIETSTPIVTFTASLESSSTSTSRSLGSPTSMNGSVRRHDAGALFENIEHTTGHGRTDLNRAPTGTLILDVNESGFCLSKLVFCNLEANLADASWSSSTSTRFMARSKACSAIAPVSLSFCARIESPSTEIQFGGCAVHLLVTLHARRLR